MKNFKVTWVDTVKYSCEKIVEANDEEEAIKIARKSEDSSRIEEFDAEVDEFDATEVKDGEENE